VSSAKIFYLTPCRPSVCNPAAKNGELTLPVCILLSLKPIDIEFMRRLHQKVNLIPVIAKSDTLTDDEIKAFKSRVSRQ
jgi:hypothetical protein